MHYELSFLSLTYGRKSGLQKGVHIFVENENVWLGFPEIKRSSLYSHGPKLGVSRAFLIPVICQSTFRISSPTHIVPRTGF